MVEGATAVAAGKAAATAAPGVIKKAVRLWRLSGLLDPGYLRLQSLSGEVLELTVSDVTDIETFLASDQLRPLLSLTVASRLLGDNTPELAKTLGNQFDAEARRWCTDSKQKWDKSAPAIWERIAEVVGISMPNASRAERLEREIEEFTGHVQSVLADRAPASVAELNVTRLLELASNLKRVSKALTIAATMTALERERQLPPIMSHSDIENPPTFAKLYVARTLQDTATGASVSSHDITHAEAPFRLVLLGNPGAGKSTFVRNLAHELSTTDSADDIGQGCVIVRCREYLKSGSFRESIADYITESQKTAGLPSLTSEGLTDALLLGQIVVIFDGLDEISQVGQRAEMVERVQTFAHTYPLTSVLVTSREVGYARASLDETLFHHTRLRDFSDSQVAEYTQRWFEAQGAEHLIEPFTRESQTVLDLRSSPLLLSLLCVLYRARGSLPRRRLEVYSRCADLLFHKWDSHRQIDQPEELPKYGNRLMQEIARWVFDSTAAQEGIPESQLEKVIAIYLSDVGIDKEEAKHRAKEFVEFCAGRAWLLGSFGTTVMDERVFQFTHRTFYEYFTAEALARASKDAGRVSEHIRTAFTRDETSVLPELLIQAFDEKQERGGPEVFKEVCATGGVSGGLILRLMNGSLLSNYTRTLGFQRIVEGWKADKRSMGRDAFDALFTLEPSAFDQFVSQYVDLKDGSNGQYTPSGRGMFAHGWATAFLRRRDHFASDGVAKAARRLADEIVARGQDPNWDLAVWNWLIASGDLPLPERDTWLFLAVGTSSGNAPGAVPTLLSRWMSRRKELNSVAAVSVLNGWLDSLEAGDGIPKPIAQRMLHAEPNMRVSFEAHALTDPDDELDTTVFRSLLAMAMIAHEVGYEMSSPWLAEAALVRASRLGYGLTVSDDLGRRVADVFRPLPEWARHWVLGRCSFVSDDIPPDAPSLAKGIPQSFPLEEVPFPRLS